MTLITRRYLLRSLAAAPLLAACPAGRSGSASQDAAAPVAGGRPVDAGGAAGDGGGAPPSSCVVTEDNIEGPFFLAGAPHRAVLVTAGDAGTRLLLSGRVLTERCEPLAGVRIDVWQADAQGAYDVDGFRFRGQLVTSADGSWQVATIIPGRYLNGAQYRPAHVHVKLEHPRFAPLTTQLYFDGDPYNGVDPWVKRSLILPLRDATGGKSGTFDFVLARA